LGPYECSGQVAVTGMPKSCEDLWRGGHTLSGLYSIVGSLMVESVYCDFSKLPDDAGKYLNSLFLKSNVLMAPSLLNYRFPEMDWICRCKIFTDLLLRPEKCRF
jgi:hypothetical protein